MPSDRFFRLREEKKREIISAAETEFSNNRYENISISRIIKMAGISHGSFYTYFEGKEDLRQYLAERISVELLSWFFNELEQCDGNICDTALYAVARIVKLDKESKAFCTVKNTILDISWTGRAEDMVGFRNADLQVEFERFAKVCYERTDLKSVNVIDEAGFTNIVELLLMIIMKSAVQYVTSIRCL